jgi:predicted NUDIX family phosphoesterase
MKPQAILAADASFFDAYPRDTFVHNQALTDAFIDGIAPHLVLRQREALETNPAYRQLLPYVIVRQIGSDAKTRFLTYRRTKLIGEERLADKVSIGFGGHIDAADVEWMREGGDHSRSERDPMGERGSILDLASTLHGSAVREMEEELKTGYGGFGMRARNQFNLIPADKLILHYEGVQIYHVGILYYVDLPADCTAQCKEAELETIGFSTIEELAAMENMEVWSKLFIDSLMA